MIITPLSSLSNDELLRHIVVSAMRTDEELELAQRLEAKLDTLAWIRESITAMRADIERGVRIRRDLVALCDRLSWIEP